MKRLDKTITGFSLALTAAAVYAACAAAYAFWPAATLGFFNAWFHGIDLALLTPAGGKGLTLGVFFYGLLGVTLSGFVIGVVYATVHNFIRRLRNAGAKWRRALSKVKPPEAGMSDRYPGKYIGA